MTILKLGLFILLICVSCAAQSIIVPPQFRDTFGSRGETFLDTQVIYSSNLFAAAEGNELMLTAVSFRTDESERVAMTTLIPRVVIGISTTTKQMPELNSSQEFNRGADFRVVADLRQLPYAAKAGGSLDPNFRLAFQEPYIYHRDQGNLVLDIDVTGGSSPIFDLDAHGYVTQPEIRSVKMTFNGYTIIDQGLIAQFDYTVVPEPPSWTLMLLSGLSLLFRRRS